MIRKKLVALCTATFILLSSIAVSAKPLGLYLQSKSNPNVYLYISYTDYSKGYASKNSEFRKILNQYEIKGVSVDSGTNKKVVNYSEYIKEFEKGSVKNFDEYVDKSNAVTFENPSTVKELNKNGTIGKDMEAPDKPKEEVKDYIDISAARAGQNGTEVTIRGVVTAKLGNNAYVQDDTGGIYVFLEGTVNQDLKFENLVKVTGKLDEYQNLKQISYKLQPIKVENLGEAELPDPKLITAGDIGEALEGQLVTIKDLTITSVSSTTASSGYDINATDKDNKAVYIRVDKNVSIPSSNFKANDKINVTAPMGQFGAKYQLMVRNAEDIEVTSGENPGEPATIKNFIKCSIFKGTALPTQLLANMSNGTTKTFKVQWPLIDINELGVRTVNITVDGQTYPIELEIKELADPGNVNLPEELKLYYNDAFGKTGNDLRKALHDIIDDHKKLDYSTVWEALKETDEDPNNKNNVILLYKGTSTPKTNNGGMADNWNREHVWAKSRGQFGTSKGAGTDVHHLRPEDVSVNGARGHLDFDNGGTPNSEAPQNKADSDSWEPRDAVKGDVARMLFYMAIRYEGDVSGEVDLEIIDRITKDNQRPEIGKLSTLLQWHKQDPVDAFEMNRNNVAQKWQGNRNPFIDNPEWVNYINWDKSIKTINNFVAEAA